MNDSENLDSLYDIAIIGMAGRFPGARNLDQFWANLRDGVESISFFSDEELLASGVDPANLTHPNYVKGRGALDDVELFDAMFFGFSPNEAKAMDPQHRFFLECSWEALENAGYDPERFNGPIAVYAGLSTSTYALNSIINGDLDDKMSTAQVNILNGKDHLPTQVSYRLNLKGPSVNVQSACSTSLVAVHLACLSLLNEQCDMALAGGVSISGPQKTGYFFIEGWVNSPDGHTRAFDSNAAGTLGGSGVGVVVLKRLADAVADGDYIQAVIKGSAINNDGALKIGYAAPGVEGQAKVITEALAISGIDPETISYVETHGTGTPLGDPIEVAALTKAYRSRTEKKQFCAIGSLKTNVGHLDTAAGVGGLVKTVLAIKNKQKPPSLHFEQPNPEIDFDNSPFFVNSKLTEWKTNGTPRRAGVSSFGLGGTNAHVILEEAPVIKSSEESRPWQLLLLSAKTSSALETATLNLGDYLKQAPEANLADVAYSLQAGRAVFNHRRAVVCRNLNDALDAIATKDSKRFFTSYQERRNSSVVFMFPGGGAQYANMGLELYQSEPAFREHVDACAEILRRRLGVDFRKFLYPTEESFKEAVEKLKQPILALTSLFAVEYALAKLWIRWGVFPKAMIGHSLGEYVAACLAGVFSLEDALSLVALRGELFEQLPQGGMLSVELAQDDITPLMNESLSLAAINGPLQHVLSGPLNALDRVEKLLSEKQVEFRRLHVDVAAHSKMLSPILDKFGGFLKTLHLKSPEIPYISNVTGTWITAEQSTDPEYWVKHLRQTVCFSAGIQELLKDTGRVFLEVGPGQTLSTLTKLHTEQSRAQAVVSSIRHPYDQQSDVAFLLASIGKLWMAGAEIDWPKLYGKEKRYRVPLPTYPFERQHYWIEPQRQNKNANQKLLNKKADIADWFYIPSWKRSLPPGPLASNDCIEKKTCWLVFVDECGVGNGMLERLKYFGQDVITVKAAEEFDILDEHAFALNPRHRPDYDELMNTLRLLDKIPQNIIHLWSVTSQSEDQIRIKSVDRTLDRGFYSLIFLAQAIGEQAVSDPLEIAVVSNGMHEVIGGDLLYPEKATVLGPCKVIPQEYPNITCRSFDLFSVEQENWKDSGLVDQLLAEFGLPSKPAESVIAYRNNHRLVQTFEAIKLNEVSKPGLLRESGVYLITGGLGGIALELSQYLAQTLQAKLVLVGRSALPARKDWARWLESHDSEDPTSSKIRKIETLETCGAEVLILTADVADPEQMQAAVDQAYEKFGAIHGVIHAAGVGGGGIIQLKTAEMAESVLAPKVKGTLVLDAIFKDKKLDFLVLCSSGNALVGGFGLVDYCAANVFLDSFAQYDVSRHGNLTISINWDTWQEVGRALDTSLPADLQWFRDQNLQQKILSKEGVDAFTRILARPLPQVVVSTRDLKTKMEEGLTFKVADALEEAESKDDLSRPSHPRPQLGTDYVAPRSDLERSIAEMWQELFGIEQVGINDSFFDLGGHSVLATQLVSWLRKTFQIDLPLRTIFEAPTIAEWAEAIARRQAEHTENEQITQLLAEVKQLSEDEAQAAVAAEIHGLESRDGNG